MNISKGDTVKIVMKRDIAENKDIDIKIYNLSGEIIKTIRKTITFVPGWNVMEEWNGTNDIGKNVGRGMYFILIKVDDMDVIKRIMIIK